MELGIGRSQMVANRGKYNGSPSDRQEKLSPLGSEHREKVNDRLMSICKPEPELAQPAPVQN